MNKVGWLVNDRLTAIPGTKTFWHDLLDNIPGLEDKTGGYTDYNVLADAIEQLAINGGPPDYLIRGATYFRPMDISCSQISLLQDILEYNSLQVDVCNMSTVTVFNSEFARDRYAGLVTHCDTRVIPLGVDFDFFIPLENKEALREELAILPDSLLFIGAPRDYPKGFGFLLALVDNSNYNFCFVMKEPYESTHPRVKVFNSVPHALLLKIINSCTMLLCTSVIESQHLAGIEAAACGLPIVTTNVGAYYQRPAGEWGCVVNTLEDPYLWLTAIRRTLDNRDTFSPREYFLKEGFDKSSCMARWRTLIEEI